MHYPKEKVCLQNLELKTQSNRSDNFYILQYFAKFCQITYLPKDILLFAEYENYLLLYYTAVFIFQFPNKNDNISRNFLWNYEENVGKNKLISLGISLNIG